MKAAFEEIFKHGFRSASIQRILKKTDLTKGAFFHHFPTKEMLGHAIVDEILVPLIQERWLSPLDNYENPAQGILENFKKIIQETPVSYLKFGCPLNNLVQELSPVDPAFQKQLKRALEFWIDGIELNLRKAMKRGYLKKGIKIRELAEFIVMIHEGSFGLVKNLKDKNIFLSFQNSLKHHLGMYAIR
jgi:AcrR family transcriptional regulator